MKRTRRQYRRRYYRKVEGADDAGLWHYKGEAYERVQMLTVSDILEDKRLFRTPARLQYRDDHFQQSLKF